MEDIKDVQIINCEKSNFVKPRRILYTQNGKKKVWDAIKVHDSVAIVIYNVSRQVLVFVKQFRPAVYLCQTKSSIEQRDGASLEIIDHEKYPASLGIIYELCAGIVDKDKPSDEIAKEEILEECGYDVPLENLRRITGFVTGVGTNGSWQDMFYAEVTDDMKVSAGGGNADEGELIDIVEIPVSKGREFIMDETVLKPDKCIVWTNSPDVDPYARKKLERDDAAQINNCQEIKEFIEQSRQ